MNKLYKTSLQKRILSGLVGLGLIASFMGNAPAALSQSNPPPVAVNDHGEGYTTTRHRAFITGNVLGNDLSPLGGPLSVQSFDSSKTKGKVSLVNPWQDGSLDPSFGSGGKANPNLGGSYQADAMLIQPDDRILLAGDSYLKNGPIFHRPVVARFLPDGAVDMSFNHTGVVTTTFPGNAVAYALALQPDGKIVISGAVDISNSSTSHPMFILARLNPDGTSDVSFGSQGQVITDFDSNGAISSSVAVQPDGKIIAAGWAYNGVPNSDYHNFALARYNPDGSLDASFGQGGRVISTFGNSSAIESIALQTDGKILVDGFSGNWPSSDFALARYTPEGKLDQTFHYSGSFTTRFGGDSVAMSLAVQPDGKIIAAGMYKPYAYSIYYEIGMARYNPDGGQDGYFNLNQLVTTNLGMTGYATGLALQPDGKIIAAGNVYDGIDYEFAAVRYTPDGALDKGFNGDGILTTPFINAVSTHYHVSAGLQSTGKLVLGGSAGNKFALARYTYGGSFLYDPNGQFDTLAPKQTATDSFTYTVSDGVLTSTATVTITITGAMEYFLPVAR